MISIDIKEATKKAHIDLEKKVVIRLKAISNDSDYANFLKFFYAYFSHLEKAISPFITTRLIPDYEKRRNSSFLKNDIEAVGGTIDNLPATKVPVIENHLEALGAMYVMEGSIMGGQIIVKILNTHGITKGVSFFSGYGEHTQMMWKSFTDVLNREASNEEQKKTMIRVANETFNCFSSVFENAGKLLQNLSKS